MKNKKHTDISPSGEIAYAAVMCALLIGGQYIFSFVVGVEIVTLLLVCFSFVFGIRRGVICAAAFSLLRCLLFGFYPTVIILYLIYYPLIAALFGALGHLNEGAYSKPACAVIINLILTGLAVVCVLCYALDLIKVSRIYKITAYTLIWVIFSACVCLCIAFNCIFAAGKFYNKKTDGLLKLITVTSVAAVCTIFFTLLDDAVTPLVFGYSRLTALAYFYASFTAMLPQTVCTIVTMTTLYLPLTAVLNRIIKKART